MKRTALLFSIGLMFALTIGGCTQSVKVEQLHQVAQTLLGNETGDFRDLEFGMSVETTKQTEKAELVEQDEGFLYYTIELGSKNRFIDLYYFFNGSGLLDKINADIVLSSDETANQVINDLSQYFDSRYGNAEEWTKDEDSGNQWNYEDTNNGLGEIELRMFKQISDDSRYTITLTMTKFPTYEN